MNRTYALVVLCVLVCASVKFQTAHAYIARVVSEGRLTRLSKPPDAHWMVPCMVAVGAVWVRQ